MKIESTNFDGVFVIEPQVFGDSRGWFMESFSETKFETIIKDIKFVQDNHSFSAEKGTLRGLHYQRSPKAQTKLIRCTQGRIYDVVVDLRKNSETYKKWMGIELSAENKKQLLIPKGFAHGFITLTENVEIQYKVDEFYSKENDRSIRFDDPDIGIEWGATNPILSEKDRDAPLFIESDHNF